PATAHAHHRAVRPALHGFLGAARAAPGEPRAGPAGRRPGAGVPAARGGEDPAADHRGPADPRLRQRGGGRRGLIPDIFVRTSATCGVCNHARWDMLLSSGAYDAGTLNATWCFAERAARAPLFRLPLASIMTRFEAR